MEGYEKKCNNFSQQFLQLTIISAVYREDDMGLIKQFPPHKLVIPALLSDEVDTEGLIEAVEAEFGPIDYRSSELSFHYTDYYRPEMGDEIRRLFLAVRDLVAPEQLAAVKTETNRIEEAFLVDGRRRANLDPGLLSMGSFVLATTKDSPHRIALSGGIWAELTLLFEAGDYIPLRWTYPDYRSEEYRAVLREIRLMYKRQMKAKS
jgi:hypothetical protein